MKNLIINGTIHSFEDTLSLEDIIENLNVANKVMAIAINMDVIKKNKWAIYIPSNEDKIELLQFVGGG
jgi:sulfur carrier protein